MAEEYPYYPSYPSRRRPDDFDMDASLTATQFILSPYHDIPKSERKQFEKFYMMFSHIMALGNIKRTDILGLVISFEEICILLEMGLYDDARQIMGKELMKMQASRSIEGFQTLFGRGIERTESIQKVLMKKKKKGLMGRFFGGGGEKESSHMLESGWNEVNE